MSGNGENRKGITGFGKIFKLVGSKDFEQENNIPEATATVQAAHSGRSQKCKGSTS
jgi:hypothetical protein